MLCATACLAFYPIHILLFISTFGELFIFKALILKKYYSEIFPEFILPFELLYHLLYLIASNPQPFQNPVFSNKDVEPSLTVFFLLLISNSAGQPKPKFSTMSVNTLTRTYSSFFTISLRRSHRVYILVERSLVPHQNS